jgi:V8-like Glu-specific endopeptidase
VAGRGARIEDVVGAERLGIGQPANSVVRVTGYPDGSGQPVSCQNRASSFSATQLQFDCDGYTDGTSGSPFLTDVNPVTGDGTVIGVIGGYQQGGDSPDVSYAAAFGPSVRALYDAAVAGK